MISFTVLLIATSFWSKFVQAIPSPIANRAATAPNPYVSQFPVGATVTVSAQSHASYYQLVNINDGDNAICALQGSGENVKMYTPAGQDSCSWTAAATLPVTLSILFQYSSKGAGGPFSNSVVLPASPTQDSPQLEIITVTSEDHTDNDDNDTYLTIAVFDPNGLPSADAVPEATTSAGFTSTAKAGDLHFNVNAPNSKSGDLNITVGAFAGASTTTDFVASTETWGSVVGKIIDDTTSHPLSNYLLLQFAFKDSKTSGLENATLFVNGLLPYSKGDARPTGTQSVEWVTSLTGASI